MTMTIELISQNAIETAEAVHGSQHDAIDAVLLYVLAVAEDLQAAGVHEPHTFFRPMLTAALDRLVQHGVDKISVELVGW